VNYRRQLGMKKSITAICVDDVKGKKYVCINQLFGTSSKVQVCCEGQGCFKSHPTLYSVFDGDLNIKLT
jgi:hypothetical protein